MNKHVSATLQQILKMTREKKVTDFRAVVFVKQFLNSCMKFKEVSPVNLTMLSGDFKTKVFNV